MSILVITSVAAEAKAIGEVAGATIIVGGIGRTNAASATTEHILKSPRPNSAVLCAGVAGALPNSNLKIGDIIVASSCIYHEEGIISPTGFANMASIGFALGDFPGNCVPVDETLLEMLSDEFPIGPIATVATCSGTNAAAIEVERRTGALAEAMEGAAVVHAARRLKIPAIEIRVISNTTGDRQAQQWDLKIALTNLGKAVHRAVQNVSTK